MEFKVKEFNRVRVACDHVSKSILEIALQIGVN